ncbi:OmpA family protein [Tropicimonas sp. TH_r6]|uniref:OmpA family protein n=1 Tax=Tropicimonas sp. TH_r6 TaxID=3082085 RepID=UPI0029533961|nr:OmpA family protein [Tropicimonas sp. TH_r6]MDV7144134.1 OmpA family protein [Tropicimonas sp. TH_r6]
MALIHPGNAVIRKQKVIGRVALGLAILFVGLSGAGLIFPRWKAPDIRAVHFQVGSRLAAEDIPTINAVADLLLDAPGSIAIVTGHTGSDGDPAANLRLSRDRANVVVQELVTAGIPEDRIVARGAAGAAPPPQQPGESSASLAARTKRAEIRLVERNLIDLGSSQ